MSTAADDLPPAPPRAVLETALYARDLDAAARFYRDVLGLVPYQVKPGRHVFYRLDHHMLLVFNPDATRVAPLPTALPVPPHGCEGEGHVCFTATAAELDAWRRRFEAGGVAIEADFIWPTGGRSIYIRDPAGNSIEFAEPKLWGL